jgi:hypothetical protein
MTAELRAEIENRIAELKPQERAAWKAVEAAQEAAAPLVKVADAKRDEWCKFRFEIRELETLLGAKP